MRRLFAVWRQKRDLGLFYRFELSCTGRVRRHVAKTTTSVRTRIHVGRRVSFRTTRRMLVSAAHSAFGAVKWVAVVVRVGDGKGGDQAASTQRQVLLASEVAP